VIMADINADALVGPHPGHCGPVKNLIAVHIRERRSLDPQDLAGLIGWLARYQRRNKEAKYEEDTQPQLRSL